MGIPPCTLPFFLFWGPFFHRSYLPNLVRNTFFTPSDVHPLSADSTYLRVEFLLKTDGGYIYLFPSPSHLNMIVEKNHSISRIGSGNSPDPQLLYTEFWIRGTKLCRLVGGLLVHNIKKERITSQPLGTRRQGCWQAAEKGLPQAWLNTHIYMCIQMQIFRINTDMWRHQTCSISLHARTHPNTHTRIHIHTTERSHPYSYTDTHNQTSSYELVH